MSKSVQKKQAVGTPKDLADTNVYVREVGEIDRFLAKEKARLETAIERLRAQSLVGMEEVAMRRAGLMKAIHRFAKKNRQAILPPDRKSVELSAGTIGWRLTPTKVVIAGNEETLLAWLEANRMPRFLRHSVELNREQLLEEKPDMIPGVSFDQKEKFFVEPKVETLPEEPQSAVRLVYAA